MLLGAAHALSSKYSLRNATDLRVGPQEALGPKILRSLGSRAQGVTFFEVPAQGFTFFFFVERLVRELMRRFGSWRSDKARASLASHQHPPPPLRQKALWLNSRP